MWFNRKKTDEQLYDLCSIRQETNKNGFVVTYITPEYNKLSPNDLRRLIELTNKIFCQRSLEKKSFMPHTDQIY